ncbi:MAG: hypothetical protein GYB35_13290 [Algicola sp.]|nr:hypothetical protein [Algicola sp.]
MKNAVDSESKSIIKKALMLVLGSGLSKAIGILSLPLIARIYTPAEFGGFSLYMALVLVLVPIFSLRYTHAIPLTESLESALSVLMLILVLNLCFMVLFLVLIVFGKLFDTSLNVFFFLLVLVGVFFVSLNEALNMFLVKLREYKPIALIQVQLSLVTESVKVFFGLFTAVNTGLIFGHIAGYGFALFRYKGYVNITLPSIILSLKFFNLKASFLRYKSFPVWRAPSQLMQVAAIQAPIILTSIHYADGLVGQVGLSITLLSLPFILIGQSISKLFYGEIANKHEIDNQELKKVVIRLAKKIVFFSVIIPLILVLFSEELFSFFLGDDWLIAAKITTILSFYIPMQLASSPFVEIFNFYGGQKIHFKLSLIRLIVVLFSFELGVVFFENIEQVIFMYSIGLLIFYMYLLANIIKVVDQGEIREK